MLSSVVGFCCCQPWWTWTPSRWWLFTVTRLIFRTLIRSHSRIFSTWPSELVVETVVVVTNCSITQTRHKHDPNLDSGFQRWTELWQHWWVGAGQRGNHCLPGHHQEVFQPWQCRGWEYTHVPGRQPEVTDPVQRKNHRPRRFHHWWGIEGWRQSWICSAWFTVRRHGPWLWRYFSWPRKRTSLPPNHKSSVIKPSRLRSIFKSCKLSSLTSCKFHWIASTSFQGPETSKHFDHLHSNVFNKRLSKVKSLLDSQSVSFWSTVNAVGECFLADGQERNEYLRYLTLTLDIELKDPQVAILWVITSYRKQLKCKSVSQSDIQFVVSLINTIISKEDATTVSSSLLTSLRLVTQSYHTWTDRVDLILPYFDLTVKGWTRSTDWMFKQRLRTGKSGTNNSCKLLECNDDFTRPDLFTLTLRTWCYVIDHHVQEQKSAEIRFEQQRTVENVEGQVAWPKQVSKEWTNLTELGLYKLLTLFITFTYWAPRDRWNELVLCSDRSGH